MYNIKFHIYKELQQTFLAPKNGAFLAKQRI